MHTAWRAPTHPRLCPRAAEERHGLVKVLLVALPLERRDAVHELFALLGPRRTAAVVLCVGSFPLSALGPIAESGRTGRYDAAGKGTHRRLPFLERLDQDDDGGDVRVRGRVHRRIVVRVGVLDERRERVREAEIDDGFRMRLDDCARMTADESVFQAVERLRKSHRALCDAPVSSLTWVRRVP